jgi:hypothetical protein
VASQRCPLHSIGSQLTVSSTPQRCRYATLELKLNDIESRKPWSYVYQCCATTEAHVHNNSVCHWTQLSDSPSSTGCCGEAYTSAAQPIASSNDDSPYGNCDRWNSNSQAHCKGDDIGLLHGLAVIWKQQRLAGHDNASSVGQCGTVHVDDALVRIGARAPTARGYPIYTIAVSVLDLIRTGTFCLNMICAEYTRQHCPN